jgi:hypothetical protein
MPNNEAILLLVFPFNGDRTDHVSIFRLFFSGAVAMQSLNLRPALEQKNEEAIYCQNMVV